MSKPYPGYPPSYKEIPKVGNYIRECLVIELLCIDKLEPAQLAQIRERLEAALEGIANATVEKKEVITSDRFDPVLKQGLRLP